MKIGLADVFVGPDVEILDGGQMGRADLVLFHYPNFVPSEQFLAQYACFMGGENELAAGGRLREEEVEETRQQSRVKTAIEFIHYHNGINGPGSEQARKQVK